MPEEKQDPASTQMFRAFVARGEAEAGDRRGTLPVVLVVVAVVVVAAVVVALIAS